MNRLVLQLFRITAFLLLVNVINAGAQVSKKAHKRIAKLTSEKFFGRGYVKGGDSIAADYLAKQFKQTGLLPIDANYFQKFTFSVNTFPNQIFVNIAGKALKPGYDFIVEAASGRADVTCKLFNVTDSVLPLPQSECAYVISKKYFTTASNKTALKNWLLTLPNNSGVVLLEPEKLTWTVATQRNSYWGITVLEKVWPKADSITVNISSHFKPVHATQNVIGYLPGNISDTFMVVTAHYDHLGGMGDKVFFPGANDNASGVSMLLDVAQHFALLKNRKYSMLFIAFAGEEAGLIGSKYYVDNPLKPLSTIKFLINLDLLGTGDEGLMVVNAVDNMEAFNKLDSINEADKLLPVISKRGKAANSDHYWFGEKKVPAVFLYTMGGIKAYHDVFDIAKTLPLTKYNEVFSLLTTFIKTF